MYVVALQEGDVLCENVSINVLSSWGILCSWNTFFLDIADGIISKGAIGYVLCRIAEPKVTTTATSVIILEVRLGFIMFAPLNSAFGLWDRFCCVQTFSTCVVHTVLYTRYA